MPPTNSLRDLDVYVRYTTAIPQFHKQAEAWLFRSISLFWPKNIKVVILLDKENAGDRVYVSKVKKSALNKKITFKVCYMEAYPPEMIHHWGKMRMYMDMMHADLCTNATYVGLADVDTLFNTAVTPSLVMEPGNRERSGTLSSSSQKLITYIRLFHVPVELFSEMYNKMMKECEVKQNTIK